MELRTNCGSHAFEPLAPRKAHRGGTVRHCRSIEGHDHVDPTSEADTSPCFLLRRSSRLLLLLPFCLLLLFCCLLFPALFLILLAFVSHCVPPFPGVSQLLAARSIPASSVLVSRIFSALEANDACGVPLNLRLSCLNAVLCYGNTVSDDTRI